MAIQYKKDKEELIVYVKGELDYDHGEKLYEFIKQKALEFNRIIINLERVSYVNTDGLQGLISTFNYLKNKKFLVEKLQDNIKEIFAKIGLLNLIPTGK